MALRNCRGVIYFHPSWFVLFVQIVQKIRQLIPDLPQAFQGKCCAKMVWEGSRLRCGP